MLNQNEITLRAGKKYVILAVGVFVLAIGGYYWFNHTSPQKYNGPTEKITVGLLPVPEANAAFLLAQAKGYFANNGLNVISKEYSSSVAVEAALKNGEIDVGAVADFTNVGSLFTNPTERILARFATVSDASFKIITKKTSGIHAWRDLKGKKVGLAKGSAIEYLLDRNLLLASVRASDVRIVDALPATTAELLTTDQADAVILAEPFASNLIGTLGAETIVTLTSESADQISLLAVTDQNFINAHSRSLQSLLASVLKANQFMRDNPAETKTIMARLTPNTKPADKDRLFQLYQTTLELPQSLLLAMEDKARWYIDNKLTDQTEVPNYLNSIYFDALEKVKPEAITITH